MSVAYAAPPLMLLLLQFTSAVVLIIAQTSPTSIRTLPPGVSAFVVSSSSTTTKRPRPTRRRRRRRRSRPSTTRIRNEPSDNIGVRHMILTKDIVQQQQLPGSTVSLDVINEDDSATATFNSSTQEQVVEQPLSYHLYLLSLRWSSSSNGNDNSFSKSTADIWRWKDVVLGDGRDYFIPKPKTLSALQAAIIDQVNNNNNNNCNCNEDPEYTIKECVVLSNCARFEILLAVDVVPPPPPSSSSCDGDDGHDVLLESIKTEISKALLLQVHSYQNRRKKNPLLELQLKWDSPDWIVATAHDTETETKIKTTNDLSDQISELRCRDSWAAYRGPRDIANHLCHIAAGMAMRPRRPDRRVVFRPFSSRDAHILLQLKRTLDTATNNNNNNVAGNACSTLLRYSLQAGKAARNPDKVTDLAELKRYGSGDNYKYSTEPPTQLTKHVQEAVKQQVVDPTVQQAVESLLAQEQSSSIKNFRQRAEAMACSNEELQWIRKRIHQPTLELRANNNNNIINSPAVLPVESMLGRLTTELDELRSQI